jgi:preprotein translocase subunit Sss1
MRESAGIAIVVVVGFVVRYSWWVRPRRRRAPAETDPDRLDYRNLRDVATIAILVVGTVAGAALVVGGLLLKSR